MIIVFGNQKGGCGKTTNCIQFANYLAEIGKDVLVLDLDFQRSLSDRRESDLNTYDNPPKYEVMKGELSQVANLLGDFNAVDNGNLLIDLPGKIDDDSLGVILKAADIIVCPFKYDRLTIDSTGLFIKILQYMEVKAKIFFLPNNIRTAVRYDTKEQIVNILNTIGEVTDEIPQSVLMERINTLIISNEAMKLVKEPYDKIIADGKIE
ncbi:ParA family protein [Phocaeicola barnesiae]|jgi:chromosome partitioning protein|uniref:ParA family protein n=1 Tax=Phocaeicola barnesiae TaxID=376804 RepID=UPI0025A4482D|nr:ParA family protein [Phocaeicola barnesiae]MDM8242895.1 ParA family protein [Phocaeicola barnesiae]